MISKFIGKEQGKYERERAKSNSRDTSGTKKMQKKKKNKLLVFEKLFGVITML